MAVSQFVTFTIQVNNNGLSQEGFGTPLMLSYSAPFSGVREYSQYADVTADFAVGTPEEVMANAIFGQSPRPAVFKIAAATLKPTQQYTIGVQGNPLNSFAYKIQVDGTGVTSTEATYTSDSTATIQEIHNGLLTQLNAVTGKNYLATFAPLPTFTTANFTVDSTTDIVTSAAHGFNTGDGPFELTNSGGALPAGLSTLTDYWVIKIDADTFYFATSLANALAATHVDITDNGTGTQSINSDTTLSPVLPILVTGSAAGNWFSLDIEGDTGGASRLSCKESNTDPGIATDLATINTIDDDWYWLLTQFNSKAIVLAAAAFVEANGKAYIVSVTDTDAVNTAAGNADTLDALNALGYKRTCGKYHSGPKQGFAAASTSDIAPLQPGKWTEFGKTLSGVKPMKLTATQRTNIKARNAGTYTKEKGRSITWDGKVFSTVYGYLDITVGIDWFGDAVQTAGFAALISQPKVGYTDEDIDSIAGAINGVLHDAASDVHDLLDPGDPTDPDNPPPTIMFPKVADIAPGTRSLRKLPNGTIRGRLQGAVQSIDFIATVTF